MAHRFAYKPTGITLTCTLNDEWGIHVDGTFVDVRLTAPGGIVVLKEGSSRILGAFVKMREGRC